MRAAGSSADASSSQPIINGQGPPGSNPRPASLNLLNRLRHASTMITPRQTVQTAYDRERVSVTDNINLSMLSPGTLQRVTKQLIMLPNKIQSSWQNKIAFKIDSTPIGRAWELLDGLLNLAFCALYIYNTTYTEHEGLPYGNRIASFLLAIVLLLQYLPRLLIAVDFWRTLFSVMSVMTLLSTIPVFIAYFDDAVINTYMSAGNYVFVYPFRFVRLHLTLMACLVPSKTSILKFSLITRKSVQLVAFLLFMILTTAAFVHMVVLKTTRPEEHFSFFDSFFFAIISVTSGYSSKIVPDSTFARLVTLYVLISGVVIIPKSLAELLTLINKKSAYDHSYKKRKHQNHVVICGQFELISLRSFLKEFFCQDHGNSTVNTHIVILNPHEPGEDLKLLLDDPFYVSRVQYVRGSPMDAKSLRKVRIHEAKSCFIFSSKYATEDAVHDDACTVMRSLALKKQVRNLPLHVQVLLPEHKPHFDFLAESMICIEELKMGLLAQACRCPGFATLINLLTASLTEKNARRLLEDIEESPEENSWIREYVQGANQEIYPTSLADGFQGFKFSDVSAMIYRNFGAITFALGIPNKSFYRKAHHERNRESYWQNGRYGDEHGESGISAKEFDLVINPGNYVIKGGEMAFIIASTQKISKIISDFDPSEIEYYMTIRPNVSLLGKLRRSIKKFASSSRQKLNFTGASSSPADGIGETDPLLITASSSQFSLDGSKKPTRTKKRSASENHRLIRKTTTGGDRIDVRDLLRNNISSSGQSSLDNLNVTAEALADGKLLPRAESKTHPTTAAHIPSELFQEENTEPVVSPSTGKFKYVSKILSQAIGLNINDGSVSSSHHRHRSVSNLSYEGGGLDGSLDYGSTSSNIRYLEHLPDDVCNHYLICDPGNSFPSNLEYFIAPLRTVHLLHDATQKLHEKTSWAPIVILCQGSLTERQRRILEKFDDVFIVKGSPLSRKDLLRAGVARCRKAVVLADSGKGKSSVERTVDASSLMTVLSIEALAGEENPFIISEFIQYENVAFVGEAESVLQSPVDDVYAQTIMRPAFMTGHIYAQCMLDTIICQNYYNPHLLNILRHLIFSGIFGPKHSKVATEEITGIKHSHVWLIPLPSAAAGTRFVDMYEYLVSEFHAVPIGLYRKAPEHSHEPHSGPHDARGDESDVLPMDRHHYVCVNPAPFTKLRIDDRIYVLCPHEPMIQ